MENQPININITNLIGTVSIKQAKKKLSKKRVSRLHNQIIEAVLQALENAKKAIAEGQENQL